MFHFVNSFLNLWSSKWVEAFLSEKQATYIPLHKRCFAPIINLPIC
jgi:hypothetical protein